MKSIKLTGKYRFSVISKSRICGASLLAALLSLPLTGCLEPGVQQTVYPQTVNTAESVYSENDYGGAGLP